MWPWPDPTLRSRSLTFWSSENVHSGRGYDLLIVIAGMPQQAVHAGGDERQPPWGAFLYNAVTDVYESTDVIVTVSYVSGFNIVIIIVVVAAAAAAAAIVVVNIVLFRCDIHNSWAGV